jgi:hypothetical protein
MISENFLGIISLEEIEQIRDTFKNGSTHPLRAIALSNPPNQVKANTERAARTVIQSNRNWLVGLKSRLLDVIDPTHSSSALGEIRAYGSLLETKMTIDTTPIVGSRYPEFSVDAGDGAVIVEVHSRQLDKAQAEEIKMYKELHAALVEVTGRKREANSDKILSTRGPAHVIMPLGAPDPAKKGDSVLTNAISRIASIKSGEKQSDLTKPFVLWLDFQDPVVWRLPISLEQTAPLFTETKNGNVGTGALWFALYGRKHDPMIEMQRINYKIIEMLHNGKFAQTKGVSAVIYSMPHATILMEHPSPTHPLPPNFRASLLKLPFFQLDRSLCEWEPGLVQSRIEVEQKMVATTAKALSEFSRAMSDEPEEDDERI